MLKTGLDAFYKHSNYVVTCVVWWVFEIPHPFTFCEPLVHFSRNHDWSVELFLSNCSLRGILLFRPWIPSLCTKLKVH